MELNLRWLLVEFNLTNSSKLGHFVWEVTVHWGITWRQKSKFKKKRKKRKLRSFIASFIIICWRRNFFLNEEMSFLLTLDRTAGGRVDLASIILNALGELYEGRVASEAAFGPRWREEIFGTVVGGRTWFKYAFLLGWACGWGVLRV